MNKYSIVTLIAIIIIIIPFAYSGLNIIGANQLEYKWSGTEGFSFFAISNRIQGEIEKDPAPFRSLWNGLSDEWKY